MAHFYGTLQGSRGLASRLGGKSSGLNVVAASWQGAVSVALREVDGVDFAYVTLQPWRGNGIFKVLFDGPVSGLPDANVKARPPEAERQHSHKEERKRDE